MDGQSEKYGNQSSQRLFVLGGQIWSMFRLVSQPNLLESLPGYSLAAWQHEADRFGLWANNLGLHHRGHSSLDYRLREAAALQDIIGGLLEDLKTNLEDLKQAAIQLGCLPPKSMQNLSQPNQFCSPDEDDSQDSEEEFASSEAPAETLMKDVIDVNDSLYRLATKIRNPATRLQSVKARAFHRFDEETGIDVIDSYKKSDLRHVQELLREYRAQKPSDPEWELSSERIKQGWLWNPYQTLDLNSLEFNHLPFFCVGRPPLKLRCDWVIDRTVQLKARQKLDAMAVQQPQSPAVTAMLQEIVHLLLCTEIHQHTREQRDLRLSDWSARIRNEIDNEEILAPRLAQANTLRRQQFGYWRKHRDKKSKETANTLDQLPTFPLSQEIYPRGAFRDITNAALLPGPKTIAALSRPTTATYLQSPTRFGGDDMSTTTSVRTITPRARDARDEQVEVPSPPKAIKRVAKINKYFQCPYCFMLCSASQLQPDAWREHIFRDLRPYICTYAHCDTGHQVYDSWKDWTTHELWAHNKVWRCAEHPSITYGCISDFEQHLQNDHGKSALNADLSNAISVAEEVTESSDRGCPFCLYSITDNHTLRNHIATHLQRIALFALPRSTENEDASEIDDSSWKANAIDRASQELESLQELHFKDATEDETDEESHRILDGLGPARDKLTLRALQSIKHQTQVQYVETNKKELGQEHPITLISMVELALTYCRHDQWEEAEKLQVQVLETRRGVLGQEHPDTLTSMVDLAFAYCHQERWEEAEELQVQIVETRKKVLGKEHRDTLTSMVELAWAYRSEGRWEEAEILLVQVLRTRKKVLGQEHPDTLTSMAQLALTYYKREWWEEAEKLQVQVLETRKIVLGQEHRDTLTSMAELAMTYFYQGRQEEAEKLQMQALENKKTVLGQEHPSTLTSMAELALIYCHEEQWGKAEELQAQVLEFRKKVLGQEHPDTLTSMDELARTWARLGYSDKAYKDKAIGLMEECTELQEKVLGSMQPETIGPLLILQKWQTEK
ncbi:hypothetical protein MMC07_003824 [Pseudocyphellaria aurata]|nr:hypothetical protein [Pseudocyphellaria aurata]